MLNAFFVGLVLVSILAAAFTGRMEPLTQSIVASAGKAVELAIGLVGVLALFLGLVKVAEDGGMLRLLTRALGPLLSRLFPGVPANHPAMSAIVLNVGSNVLGLGNAATPFGIKAMQELDRLNDEKGTVTDAMALFLAINTAGFALIPTTALALRASAGSKDPGAILVTTWFASGCATLTAITATLLLSRLRRYRRAPSKPAVDAPAAAATPVEPPPAGAPWRTAIAATAATAFVAAVALHVAREWGTRPPGEIFRAMASFWVLPGLVGGLVLFGWARGVKVYASVVEGAKEGFQVALRIIPYLVAILVAVGMFRASGGIEAFVAVFGPWTSRIGLPAEALPMALIRPLSGSGAFAVMSEVIATHGPDGLLGTLVGTIQGSTETTFYVLAVYCGAVGIKRTRHTVPACLLADVAGIGAAVFIVNAIFG